ncbi:unnamed protein product, partial [Iphiclides podalirius]
MNIRDQFVLGLYSEEMRSRLFAERNIDYAQAVELSLALEAAERHAGAACATALSSSGSGGAGARLADDGLHRVSAARTRRGGGGGGGGAGVAERARRALAHRCATRVGGVVRGNM